MDSAISFNGRMLPGFGGRNLLSSSTFQPSFGLGGVSTITRSVRPTPEYDPTDIISLRGPPTGRLPRSCSDTPGYGPKNATFSSETIGSGGPSYFTTASYKSPYGNSVRMASCPGMSQYLPK